MTYGPFEFFGNPEEMRARVEAQHSHIHMHYADSVHKVKDFLDSLDKDQLDALDIIMRSVLAVDSTGHMIRGQIAQLLHKKFDVCPCGEDHDPAKEFQTPLLPQQKAPVIPPRFTEDEAKDALRLAQEEMVEATAPDGFDMNKNYITTPDNEVVELDSDRYNELLGEYDLRVLIENENEPTVRKFMCGCGMAYQSLQDRMLRPPGVIGCGGCKQKGAWG